MAIRALSAVAAGQLLLTEVTLVTRASATASALSPPSCFLRAEGPMLLELSQHRGHVPSGNHDIFRFTLRSAQASGREGEKENKAWEPAPRSVSSQAACLCHRPWCLSWSHLAKPTARPELSSSGKAREEVPCLSSPLLPRIWIKACLPLGCVFFKLYLGLPWQPLHVWQQERGGRARSERRKGALSAGLAAVQANHAAEPK